MPQLKTDNELRSKYRSIKLNGHKKDAHRHIMEELLGRKLGPNEIVHHKDGNKLNNDPSNLEVMSRSEHARLHQTGASPSDETRDKLRAAIIQGMKDHKFKFKNRPVCSYDPATGTLVKSYISINAARRDGFSDQCILYCLKGIRKEHKGLVWKLA